MRLLGIVDVLVSSDWQTRLPDCWAVHPAADQCPVDRLMRWAVERDTTFV